MSKSACKMSTLFHPLFLRMWDEDGARGPMYPLTSTPLPPCSIVYNLEEVNLLLVHLSQTWRVEFHKVHIKHQRLILYNVVLKKCKWSDVWGMWHYSKPCPIWNLRCALAWTVAHLGGWYFTIYSVANGFLCTEQPIYTLTDFSA